MTDKERVPSYGEKMATKNENQLRIDAMTLVEVIEHLDTYGYECTGGSLQNAYAWQVLKSQLASAQQDWKIVKDCCDR